MFLSVNGFTVPVSTANSPSESPDFQVGSVSYGADGSLRGSIATLKMGRRFRTPPLDEQTIAALYAAAPPNRFHACTGDALSWASVQCMVTYVPSTFALTGDGSRRSLDVVLREL
jgi:hypothetical protein